MKNWYVIYVNVRHENKVAERLREKGIEAYVPNIRVMKQWSDRKKIVEVPLISGYSFVKLSPGEMEQLRFVPGVINFVRVDGKPAMIKPAEIEGLKFFVENGFGLEEVNGEELKVGDRVKFTMTEFKLFTAIVEDFVGDDFAIVTFEGVAKNFKLKAPMKALKKSVVTSAGNILKPQLRAGR